VTANPRPDDFQRRHSWFGLPLAVVYKFFDDQGNYLTALITYYGFLSLFPLLLVAATVLGYVLDGNPALQNSILRSGLTQFPIIGTQLKSDVSDYRGSGIGLAVGLIGGLYGGMGIAQASQNAMNQIYAVPRNERPNPFAARVRSLSVLGIMFVGLLLVSALTYASSVVDVGGFWAQALTVVVGTLVNLVLFVAAYRRLTARDLTVRDVLLGASIAAVAWQVLQFAGRAFLVNVLAGRNQVYGTFGVVLGLVAGIYLLALVVVLCAEINVVVKFRLWPRSLLTPFTDAVNLTPADERAYTAYAQAQRNKGFERVDVAFDGERPAPPALSRRGRRRGRRPRR
jgi:YihY family inner membrane protein